MTCDLPQVLNLREVVTTQDDQRSKEGAEMTFTQTHWSLADLFASHDSPDMRRAFDELERDVVEFEICRPQLAEAGIGMIQIKGTEDLNQN